MQNQTSLTELKTAQNDNTLTKTQKATVAMFSIHKNDLIKFRLMGTWMYNKGFMRTMCCSTLTAFRKFMHYDKHVFHCITYVKCIVSDGTIHIEDRTQNNPWGAKWIWLCGSAASLIHALLQIFLQGDPGAFIVQRLMTTTVFIMASHDKSLFSPQWNKPPWWKERFKVLV